jgi:hypothetical protein
LEKKGEWVRDRRVGKRKKSGKEKGEWERER